MVNAGVSGDTTAGGLARLDWALADKPDLVILALGANDALRGIDPSTVRGNLDKMIGKDPGQRRQSAAARHARSAQLGRGVQARLRSDLSRACAGRITCRFIHFFSKVWR